MDKLRALHYFIAAAETSSFSGAARRLDVSVAAVAKLVTALERSLDVRLFERHARGLALTTGGGAYLEGCRAALAQLVEADEQASAIASTRARGTVVVGVQPVIAQQCLTPALPRFNALYPEIQLDLRYFMSPTDEQTRGVDVMLALGWPDAGDLVQRRIGATSFVVCAAPAYWAAHGKPRYPGELEQHNCLSIRGNRGMLMDLWNFKRGDERVSVAVRGWLCADNVHRDSVMAVAAAGGGVVRIIDWSRHPGHEIARGALVPVLTDWESTEVPRVNLLYSPSVRRVPRVRLFIDWVTQLFRDIEQQRERRVPATGAPQWLKTRNPRASATIVRER